MPKTTYDDPTIYQLMDHGKYTQVDLGWTQEIRHPYLTWIAEHFIKDEPVEKAVARFKRTKTYKEATHAE